MFLASLTYYAYWYVLLAQRIEKQYLENRSTALIRETVRVGLATAEHWSEWAYRSLRAFDGIARTS